MTKAFLVAAQYEKNINIPKSEPFLLLLSNGKIAVWKEAEGTMVMQWKAHI